MSNDTQKADQIAFHFYTKLFYVVNNARATAEPRVPPKVDKWFNLETPDSDLFNKEVRDQYRSISVYPPPPPLEIQVLLSIPELNNNQVLVYLPPNGSRVRIDPTPKHILLESWVLTFTPRPIDEEDNSDVALPTIYKHGIPLFRSLFSLLRLLPAWKLHKRFRRRTGGSNRNGNLSIHLRVRTGGDDDSSTIFGFNAPPNASALPLPCQTHAFPPVPHPMGTFSLSATYLTSPNFKLDELESLLSSRFLSQDEGPEFVPTLTKNQQRESITGSPGSLPIRTSLPKSPSSIADKFVLPSRTASLPGVGVSPRNVPLPASRYPPSPPLGSNSGFSMGSYSRNESSSALGSKEDSRPPSGLAERLRKESTGAGRGFDLPSAPSPQPIRRPSINPVHPFKSNTLSSASPSHHPVSLRQGSPLSVGLPSRPTQASPAASRVPPSPIGMGSRPSPPFAPSSLGDRRSLASDGMSDDRVPASRKRYSSSFGHRYTASVGAGSEGSAGSGDRRDNERVGSASFLSTNTDDDDISVFVQDIDSRKPLSGRHRIVDQEQQVNSRDRDAAIRTETERRDEEPRVGVAAGVASSSSGAVGGSSPMLTSLFEVDERLRKMNETFLASLEGLGGSGSGSGGSSRRRNREQERGGGQERERERQRTRGQHEDNMEGSSSGHEDRTSGRRETADGGEDIGVFLEGASDRELGRGRELTRIRERFTGMTLERPRHGSTSTNASERVSQGSEEVLGRLELDDERRRSRQ